MVPYKSQAQERFFHSSGAAAAGIKPQTVQAYDKMPQPKLPKKIHTNFSVTPSSNQMTTHSPWGKMKGI
jgi:hypothetical protein